MSKTAQHVIFPEYLNVGPYCAYGGSLTADAQWAGTSPTSSSWSGRDTLRPINYRLMSVIEHRGGAFAGHYVAYRREAATDRWLYISDDTVRPIDWHIVRNCQAYMLFYEAM
jgi:ubiquitin C-terminal hydrolase